MIRRPPRSTHCISSAASDVYKRQDKYSAKTVKNISSLDGKLRERIARNFNTFTKSEMRRKMNACKLASYDITKHALDTKRHRPAGASVLFKRAMFPTQQTKTVDASAAAQALKAELRREELAKLRQRQGKARATINPQELLPPSLLTSKHGYTRPQRSLYERPVLAPWKYPSRNCLLYTSPSPRDQRGSRMPSSA